MDRLYVLDLLPLEGLLESSFILIRPSKHLVWDIHGASVSAKPYGCKN